MSAQYQQLRAKLAELFQLDAAAELDFGIYRILNARRIEVERFLDGLQSEVEAIIKELLADKSSTAQGEAEKLKAQLESAGVDPATSPKYIKLQEEAARAGGSTFELENEIFSHLATFFSRYYKDGDFLSLRRYKRDTYAIPYEGEEVKLHWANADQFYIKSAENFRDYTFRLGPAPKDGAADARPRVTFKLIEADTERDNNKAVAGKERRFIHTSVVGQTAEALVLGFEYRALNGDDDAPGEEAGEESGDATAGKKKKAKDQATLNREAVQKILAECARGPFAEIAALRPTEKNKQRSLLEKHLADYTARNTFDYFIHKDLGGFLRRELDFFIKNEVLHLDDLEAAPEADWRQQQARLRAIRAIAHRVIRFLAQIEDFQKKLWLKKKFVTRCDYLITLDRLPAALLPEVAASAAQREEWVRLLAIDEIKADLGRTGYSEPLTVEFLKENLSLPLDTRHFGEEFRRKVMAGIEDEGAVLNGTVVRSDNAHALRLFQKCMNGRVRFSYIDPPYNTGGDDFCFKDGFQRSTWITMMQERLILAHALLAEKGVIYASIDANERTSLALSFERIFGGANRVEEIIWVQNATKNQSPTYSTNHEYVLAYARNLPACKTDFHMFRDAKPGCAEIQELVAKINPEYPPISEVETAIRTLFKKHKAEHKENPDGDEWKGTYNYNRAEYRDQATGEYVDESAAKDRGAVIWVWREDNPSMPQVKEDSQKESFRDPNDPTFRFYRPPHPVTKLPSAHPKTGWRWPFRPHGNQANCFVDLDSDHRIAWGDDETKIPQTKRFLHEVETNVAKSVIQDFTDGEKELANLFGKSRVFSNPKPTTLVARFILQAADSQSTSLDFFPGSGTTGDAVINLNREDNGTRKYVLVEMGEHFDTVLVPRLKKVIYAKDWKEGKPQSRNTGVSHACKVLRLESYEDTLNNLRLPARRPEAQELALQAASPAVRDEYTLGYMLELETQGSPSLLNVSAFTDPFSYTLQTATGTAGETRPVNVDLVETFNWLLGLTVRHTDFIREVCVVDGTNPQGERVLILWRNTAKVDAEALNEWFTKQGYSTRDLEYALIYVNGDHHLENLRRDDQTWKVRMIDEEFPRLMWEGC
jgi:adenine-specific DNA-methyltransferase